MNLRFKPDWLYELNPVGLVPILQWDDKVIYESAACSDFLDDIFPVNKLNPQDPFLRAKDRQLWESMGKVNMHGFYICICLLLGKMINTDPKFSVRAPTYPVNL